MLWMDQNVLRCIISYKLKLFLSHCGCFPWYSKFLRPDCWTCTDFYRWKGVILYWCRNGALTSSQKCRLFTNRNRNSQFFITSTSRCSVLSPVAAAEPPQAQEGASVHQPLRRADGKRTGCESGLLPGLEPTARWSGGEWRPVTCATTGMCEDYHRKTATTTPPPASPPTHTPTTSTNVKQEVCGSEAGQSSCVLTDSYRNWWEEGGDADVVLIYQCDTTHRSAKVTELYANNWTWKVIEDRAEIRFYVLWTAKLTLTSPSSASKH